MIVPELKDNWTYIITGALSSRTRQIEWDLTGFSSDNREQSREAISDTIASAMRNDISKHNSSLRSIKK